MSSSALDRARRGDGDAFRELVAPHLAELRTHCYRMLGSLTDAEDVLQETLLAAWGGLAGFEQRASLRTWLYRIATHRCLNARRRDARRVPAEPVAPFRVPDPSERDAVPWLQPYPDALLDTDPEARYAAGETIELAFVAALQRIPPRQAAVLVLRDVLGFGAAETADLVGATPTAVKGVLQRARATLDEHGPTSPARRPDRAGEDAVARRFADAYLAGDVDAVVAVLTDDVWLSMPPAPHRYHGRAAVAAFLAASFAWRGTRPVALRPAGRCNTHPAFGRYLGDPARGAGLYVLAVAGESVHAVTRFHGDALFARAGLPAEL